MRDVSDRQVRGGALAGCPSANPEETLLVASVGVATDTIAKASRCSWTIEGAERFPPTCVQIRWSCAVGHSAGSCSLSKTRPVGQLRTLQCGDRQAHCEHEQRDPQRSALPSQANRLVHSLR